jgi:FkbM family methyltransferase
MGKLVCRKVEPFGEIWFPENGARQIANLGSEIAEYLEGELDLRPGDVVVDAGANIGTFALGAAKRFPGLHFVCAEPIPVLFEALSRNFETHPWLRDTRRELHRVGLTAIGDTGEAEFVYFDRLPCDSTRYMSEKRGQFEAFFAAQGAAARLWAEQRALSVLAPLAVRLIASLPQGVLGRWASDRVTGAERVRCPLRTVDDLLAEDRIDEVALLKVDVEGAELDVLRGIAPERWSRVRQVVLEGHDVDGRLGKVRAVLHAAEFDDVRVDVPQIAKDRGLDNYLIHARRSRRAA